MSHKRTIVLLLIVASASFLFGAKIAAKKLKWPYALAKWSEPAKITELELACLKSEFRSAKIADKPIIVKSDTRKPEPVILIDRITFSPTRKFIKIEVSIRPFSKKTKLTKHNLHQARSEVDRRFIKWSRRVSANPKRYPCPRTITIRCKGKVVVRQPVKGATQTRFD